VCQVERSTGHFALVPLRCTNLLRALMETRGILPKIVFVFLKTMVLNQKNCFFFHFALWLRRWFLSSHFESHLVHSASRYRNENVNCDYYDDRCYIFGPFYDCYLLCCWNEHLCLCPLYSSHFNSLPAITFKDSINSDNPFPQKISDHNGCHYYFHFVMVT